MSVKEEFAENNMRVSTIIILISVVAVFLGMAYAGYHTSIQPMENDYADLSEIDVSIEPIQTAAKGDSIPILVRGNKHVVFKVLARYNISGLLVGTHMYRGNFMNHLAPYDYALVWGEVPNKLQYIKFKQMMRYCKYNIENPSQVDAQYVASHMSNSHLIPANVNIRRALKIAKEGMKVELGGYLVSLKVYKGERVFSSWTSSLIRTDSGGGACELIYLTKIRIGDKVYE